MSLLWICLFGLAFQHIQCDVLESGVPPIDQAAVVDKHNEFRCRLCRGEVPDQPRATDIKKMKWDDNLAAEAQKIADTLKFEHVTVTDPRWSSVRQNVFMSTSTGLSYGSNLPGAVTAWFDEVQYYTYGPCCSAPTVTTGHYTQVIWANSDHLGCGYTFFSVIGDQYPYQKLYVCNYGPGGNYVGQYPYATTGSGCEDVCD